MVSTGVNRSILIVPQAFDCTPTINMETTYYILYIFLGASIKVAVHNSGELRLLRLIRRSTLWGWWHQVSMLMTCSYKNKHKSECDFFLFLWGYIFISTTSVFSK